MDIKHFATAFVADKCARTTNVQVKDPATTATFIGAGEVVITDLNGKVLADTDIVSTSQTVVIKQRNKDGNFAAQFDFKIDDLLNASFANYKAPVEKRAVVTLVDFAQTNHTYTLWIYDDGDKAYGMNYTPVHVTVGSVAKTKAQLAAAFVAAINLKFDTENTDNTRMKLTAVVGTGDIIVITAVANDFDKMLEPYNPTRFTITAIDDFGTVAYNTPAALGTPATDPMTKGVGSGKQVAQSEYLTLGFGNAKYANVMPLSIPANLVYNADVSERYDCLTLQVNVKTPGMSEGAVQKTAHIYLPVTDNTTSQVSVLEPVLNAIIALKGFTEFVLTV